MIHISSLILGLILAAGNICCMQSMPVAMSAVDDTKLSHYSEINNTDNCAQNNDIQKNVQPKKDGGIIKQLSVEETEECSQESYKIYTSADDPPDINHYLKIKRTVTLII